MEKVLIVNLGGIGDFLLSTPAIKALKEGSDSALFLLSSPRIAQFAKKLSYIEQVYTFYIGYGGIIFLTKILRNITTLLKLKKRVFKGKRRISGIAEGGFSPGQVVLLIDDVLTLGGSKKEAILVLRKAGLTVFDLMIFVDREQGGLREMERLGCSVYAVTSLFFLLDRCLTKGRISQQKRDEILNYIESSKRAR